jgi:predicted AlkP superfamily pyrophosphatase or phosphodiesterase
MNLNIKLRAILSLLVLSSCVSKDHVSEQYKDYKTVNPKTSQQTVVLFLVDGLSLDLATGELKNAKLPNMNRFFKVSDHKPLRAHTGFPSLTFPNIASVLAERPINEHGVYGNSILKDSKAIDLSSPTCYSILNKMIADQNIFSQLKAQGSASVSLDFAFASDSSVCLSGDLGDAFSVIDTNYAELDEKILNSLKVLLQSTHESKWPEFIFVHLVGVDFLSHEKGPDSIAVKEYLEGLDQKLAPVFELLKKHEKNRKIITLASADHGFDHKISKVVLLEEAVHKIDSKIIVLNEGRYLGLYFPDGWSEKKRRRFLKEILKNESVELFIELEKQNILVESKSKLKIFTYHDEVKCPNQEIAISSGQISASCSDDFNSGFYPYFASNLAHYFKTQGHPDAIVLSKSGSAFLAKDKGQHGGPTLEEVYVPLLIRNAKLANGDQTPALWQILKFITSSEY